MLRRFLYLNDAMVDSYLGVIEGGLSDQRILRTGQRGMRGGDAGVKAGPVGGQFSGQREHSSEDESIVRDTPELRFDRLMRAVESDPDQWSYDRVLDLEGMFECLATGTLVSIDCEVEVPQLSLLLAQPEQVNELLDVLEKLAPLTSAFGGNTEGMPDPEQIKAVRTFTNMKADVVVVGEIDESTPRLRPPEVGEPQVP
jgi:hypothetical protein